MRIYLAGGSSERHLVAGWIKRCTEELPLCTVTHDWTLSPGYGRDLSESEWREQGLKDIAGVNTANFVWLLIPNIPSEGAAFELGWASAKGKIVIASGPKRPLNPFLRLVHCHFDTHQEAFEWLRKQAISGD